MRDVKFGFAGGEYDPSLWKRSDLERYTLGAAELRNFAITYAGSATVRPPLRFVEFAADPASPVKLFAFEFSTDIDNAYLLVFGSTWIRFVQDGAYVLESEKNISGILSSVVTSVAHGYSNGDLVYITGRSEIFVVASVTTDGYTLRNIEGGVTSIASGATTSRRVLTINHGYNAADIRAIKASQYNDVIKFTHPLYPPKILTRISGGWNFGEEVRGAGKPLSGTPTVTTSGKFIKSVRVTAKGSGYTEASVITVTDATGTGAKLTPIVDSGALVGVTIVEGGRNYTAPSVSISVGTGAAVEITLSTTEAEIVFSASAVIDGKETGIFRPQVAPASPDITQTRGSYTFTIPPVAGAEFYNYYRSIVFPFAAQANIGVELGWIGSSRATKFTDNNIIPDFTRLPPLYFDPFTPGQIAAIQVTTPGSGYTAASTISISDATGTGAVLYPIVISGEIVGVYIADGGKNYTSPTLTVSGGSGAAFSVTLSASTKVYPSVSFTFQQRAGYAATLLAPMTLWTSRVGEFDNFAAAEILDATDPYTYTIDAPKISRIRDVLPVQQGLMIFTRDGVSLLRGIDGNPATALSAVIEPQSFIGCAEVAPVFAAEDIIYVQEKSKGLRLLTLPTNGRKYEGAEITLFSRHLFQSSPVRAFAMSMDTENRGYGVFDNGAGFTIALNREQQLYGTAPFTTRGTLEDVACLNVGTEEHVYFAVKRGNRRVIEYIRPYESSAPEDRVALDSRISTPKVTPNADLILSGTSGVVTVTASVSVFSVADVGKLLFAAGGRGVVAAFVSSTVLQVILTREVTDLAFEANTPAFIPARTWWINPLILKVAGIPFEGQTVAVVGDGKRQTDKIVVGGEITLDSPAAIVHVGFSYKSRLKTLPPQDSEGLPVNIIGAVVSYRRVGTMSLGVGDAAPFPQFKREDEPWFEPDAVAPGAQFAYLDGSWTSGGSVVLEIEDGVDAEILQIVVFYALGGAAFNPGAAGRGLAEES